MTTSTAQLDRTTSPSRTPLLAAIGIGSSAVLTAISTFVGPNTSDDPSRDDVSTWLLCVGIAVAAAVIGFGLVVRTASRGNAARRSAIAGVVAVLSIAVFWSGLPLVLAAVALACALIDRDARGSFGTPSLVGLGLAGLTTVAAVVLSFVG